MTRKRITGSVSAALLAVLALIMSGIYFYRPAQGLPGPDLTSLLIPVPPPSNEWALTPHPITFGTDIFKDRNHATRLRRRSAPLPGGARLEVDSDGMRTCRIVRIGPNGEQATVRTWADRDHFDQGRMPIFTVSPDGRWVLYTLAIGPKERLSRVRAFSLSGGQERQWDIPIKDRQTGIRTVFWRQNSTGWLGWDDTEVSKSSVLWTADVAALKSLARAAFRAENKNLYPTVLGRTDDGLVLAVDQADTRFTSRFYASFSEQTGTLVIGSHASSNVSSAPGDKQGESGSTIPLITFDESRGTHAVRHMMVPVPPNCDGAIFLLSPDGHTLAWYVGTNPLSESRFGRSVLKRHGGHSLWIGDFRTGALRCVGKVQTSPNSQLVPPSNPHWGPDGTHILFQMGQAGEYRSYGVSHTSWN